MSTIFSLLLFGQNAYAQTQIQRVHACVNRQSGEVYIIKWANLPSTCRPGDTEIVVPVRAPLAETTLGDLTCSDGQVAVFNAASDEWLCGDQSGGAGPVAGATLGDLACSDGQVPVFNAASDKWVCGDQSGSGEPAYVLLDANGNEIGPVVGLYNAPTNARDVLDKALVAITLNDSTNTPRTVLQAVTHSQYNREFRNTEVSGASSDTPLADRQILFNGPDCTGNAFMLEKFVANTGFPPIYTPSMTVWIRGTTGEARPLYIAKGTATETADIVSRYQLHGMCDDTVTMTRSDLIRAELLHQDLMSIYPPPFTLQPR